MINKYRQAFRAIEEKIKSNKPLLNSILSIALLGSVVNDEELENLSDLDILIIFKTTSSGNIPIKNLDALREIHCDISVDYNFPISLLTHSIDDFEKYVSFEYLIHYALGSCIYPDPDFLKIIIDNILKNRNLTDSVRQSYCIYHLRHIRFNLLRKYVSLYNAENEKASKEFLKILIDKIIKITDLVLNYYNIWPKNKAEIVNNAKQILQVDTTALMELILIRNRWEEITNKEVIEFVPQGISYLYKIFDFILGDYNKSTPEENMSKL